MSVSIADVHRIASLARLTVADDRADALVQQLNAILSHMDVLQQVPGVDADAADTMAGMPLAADRGPAVALSQPPSHFAPAWREGFFVVARLATHEDASDAATEGGA